MAPSGKGQRFGFRVVIAKPIKPSTSSAAKIAPEAEKRPNILWIITDDQRSDSIAAFNRIRRDGKANSALGAVLSPNVDRLAAMGTTFINNFNHNPSCQPSRTIMHTGRYSHRTGVYGFEYHNPSGMDHWRPMVPEILRDQAGYQTITVGKLGLYAQHFANKKNPNGPLLYETDLGYRSEFAAAGLVDWNAEKKWVDGKKGPKVETFYFADRSQLTIPKDLKAVQKRLGLFHGYRHGGGKVESEDGGLGETLGGLNPQSGDRTRDASFSRVMLDHLDHAGKDYTDVLGRKQQGPDASKPVFIHCGFDFPHTPVLPPAEFREKFAKLDYEIPKLSEAEKAQFPPQIQKFFDNWETNHFNDAEKQQMVADYYAYCAYGDTLVGKLADGFISFSEKHSRPWLILYVCGDNGWKLNEHGMGAKFLHYDHDLNNPVIVVSSDKQLFPAGKAVTDFTGFVDMAPTFLAAAGIEVSAPEYKYLDGRDLAQTTVGKVRPRDYVIAEPTWVIGPRAVIRTKDYKFAMRVRPQSGAAFTEATAGKNMEWAMKAELKDLEPTLFDLRTDRGETNNVAFEPRYRPVLDSLRTKLQNIVLGDARIEVAWTKEVGDEVHRSDFSPGADDGVLALPELTAETK
jgi:arylsulfatase A-like enzyme